MLGILISNCVHDSAASALARWGPESWAFIFLRKFVLSLLCGLSFASWVFFSLRNFVLSS
jgi:hypothetical protein